MIKAVLIDIDNTLLDFDACAQTAMKDGFERFNLGPCHDHMFQVFERINTEMWRKIEEGTLTYEELLQERWNNIFSALHISFDGRRFDEYFRDCLFDSAIPVPGAQDLLVHLEDRYLLCAASNGPYEQQLNRLKKGGLLPYFSRLFISGKIGASKPSQQFFSHCLSELSAERMQRGECALLPSEVIMIGDSLTSDMLGAVNSGIKTCFFDRRASGKTGGLPIDHVVTSLDEIRKFL